MLVQHKTEMLFVLLAVHHFILTNLCMNLHNACSKLSAQLPLAFVCTVQYKGIDKTLVHCKPEDRLFNR